MMTDTNLDAERSERLARLQQRRVAPTSPVDVTTEMPVVVTPTAPSDTGAGSRRRRRAPATNAKVVTIGVSATAMLGMIAGYGVADGLTSDAEASPTDTDLIAAPVATNPTVTPPASPSVTPAPVATATATPTPQIIVVVVDGATGQTLSTTNGTGDLAVDLAAVGVTPAGESPTPEPTPTNATNPAPVAAPTAIDLAVPAPPPPPPAPAAPAPAAPAPQPQATSDGS